jgi:hypothetical protein
VALEAHDVDALHCFYVDVLGFRELPRPELGFKGVGGCEQACMLV